MSTTAHMSARSRSGQAMIEFMTGLVVVLVLLAALVQFVRLSVAEIDTMTEARAEAGQLALAVGNALYSPDYIRDWEDGNDLKPYTRDDVSTAGAVASFDDVIVEHAAPDSAGWAVLNAVPADYLPALRNHMDPVTLFGMVKGESSTDVDLISAVQSLLYRADSIEVESTVWMTSTRGIY